MSFPILPFGFNTAGTAQFADTDSYMLKHSLVCGSTNTDNVRDDQTGQDYRGYNSATCVAVTNFVSAHLASATEDKKLTVALWFKLRITNPNQPVFADKSLLIGSNPMALNPWDNEPYEPQERLILETDPTVSDKALRLTLYKGGSLTLRTYGIFQDPTAWYHLIMVIDTTEAQPADRCKLYVNGNKIIYYKEDNRAFFVKDSAHPFSANARTSYICRGQFLLADLHWMPGYVGDPSNFGYASFATGRWTARKFVRSDGLSSFANPSGNNGWRMGFDNISSRGAAGTRHDSTDYSWVNRETEGYDNIVGYCLPDDGPYQVEHYASSFRDPASGGSWPIHLDAARPNNYEMPWYLFLPFPSVEEKASLSSGLSRCYLPASPEYYDKWYTVMDKPYRRQAQSTFGVYATTNFPWYSSLQGGYDDVSEDIKHVAMTQRERETLYFPYHGGGAYIKIRLNGTTVFRVRRTHREESHQWFDFAYTGPINKIEVGLHDPRPGLPYSISAQSNAQIWGFRIDQKYYVMSGPFPTFTTDTPTNSRMQDNGVGRELSGNYFKLDGLTINDRSTAILSSRPVPGYNPSGPSQNSKWYFEVLVLRNASGSHRKDYFKISSDYNNFHAMHNVVGLITPDNLFNFGYNSGNSFFVADNGFYSNYQIGPTGRLSVTNATYVGFAFDRQANTVALYVDGVLAQTVTLGRPANNDFYVFTGWAPSLAGWSNPKFKDMTINFGDSKFYYPAPAGFKTLVSSNDFGGEAKITSGAFIGNGSVNGPVVFTNCTPNGLTINGNVVTFLDENTPVQRLAKGFKVISSSNLYNQDNTLNYFSVTSSGSIYKFNRGALTIP